MNEYTIYFEFFGKRQKTNITAENEEMAMFKLRQKILQVKIEQINREEMPNIDNFNVFEFLGIKL